MQCKQCGKWFRQFSIDQIQSKQFSIDQIYCPTECWNRAQLGGIKYQSPKLYHNGEEVKRVENFKPEKYYTIKRYD